MTILRLWLLASPLLALPLLLPQPLLPPHRLLLIPAVLPQSLSLPPHLRLDLLKLLVHRMRRSTVGERVAIGDELLVDALRVALDVNVREELAVDRSRHQRRQTDHDRFAGD